MTDRPSLTARERQAQGARWDLTAAHASHGIEDAKRVESLLVKSYRLAGSLPIGRLESDLVDAYFDAPIQVHAARPPQMFYSASVALAAIGADLQSQSRRVYAPSPTFDFMPRLLSGPIGSPRPLRWHEYLEPRRLMSRCSGGAVLVVSPNNPDGKRLELRQIAELAEEAERHDVALVVDRAFDLEVAGRTEIYGVLEGHCNRYYVIEDTGKSVAAAGMKVAFVTTGLQTNSGLTQAADDLLLSVAPFSLALIAGLIRSGERARLEAAIHSNRMLLQSLLDRLLVRNESPRTPVAWIRLPPNISADEFVSAQQQAGVMVLPGEQFYWASGAERGYVRIALARGAEYFSGAIEAMLEVCVALKLTDRAT